MNHAIIIAGGIGSRMKTAVPKQYLEVRGIPIIMYSVNKFVQSGLIDSIVIVLADEWREYMERQLEIGQINCRIVFAKSGNSREHSVLSGLAALSRYANENDIVLIHDSVRPLFPLSNIIDGITACRDYDAALPVIPVKDATYQSLDGEMISSLLPRDELYSGQSPESFVLGKFYQAHQMFTDTEIQQIRGSSELALKAKLTVKLIPGIEQNFKITTIEDLRAFEVIENAKETCGQESE
jgi:2-C-methyl-D-erythritol 4-phosphate cytidylyltransferase